MLDFLSSYISFRESTPLFSIIVVSIVVIVFLLMSFDRLIEFINDSIGNLVFRKTKIQKREREYSKFIEDEYCSDDSIDFSKQQREFERFSSLHKIYRQELMLPIIELQKEIGNKFVFRDFKLAQHYLIVNKGLALAVRSYKRTMIFNIIGASGFGLGMLLMLPAIIVTKTSLLTILFLYTFIFLSSLLTGLIFGRPLMETFAAKRINDLLTAN
jgi:hypothetical protein